MEAAPSSKLSSLDESANKELKLLEVNGSAIPKSSDNGRISVSGYDSSLECGELESILRKLFDSCGIITDVYILKEMNNFPKRTSYIYFRRGEGAVDKALKLNGTNVGAWKLHVEPYPDFKCRSSLSNYTREIGRVVVSGYDTGHSLGDVESVLRKHFSSCGEITDVFIGQLDNNILRKCSIIYFLGEGAVVKALELSGTDVGGWNVHVEPYPEINSDYSSSVFFVEGYNTKLSEDAIRLALSEHFHSCGVVKSVMFFCSAALVTIAGKDIEKKVLQLNGSDMAGGHKLIVKLYSYPAKQTVHRRVGSGLSYCRPVEKKAKMSVA